MENDFPLLVTESSFPEVKTELPKSEIERIRNLDWRFIYSTPQSIDVAYKQAKIWCDIYNKPFNDKELIDWALGKWKPVI